MLPSGIATTQVTLNMPTIISVVTQSEPTLTPDTFPAPREFCFLLTGPVSFSGEIIAIPECNSTAADLQQLLADIVERRRHARGAGFPPAAQRPSLPEGLGPAMAGLSVRGAHPAAAAPQVDLLGPITGTPDAPSTVPSVLVPDLLLKPLISMPEATVTGRAKVESDEEPMDEEEENELLRSPERSPVSSPTVTDAECAASELVPAEAHDGGTSEQDWEDIASTTGSDPTLYLASTIEGSDGGESAPPPPPIEVKVVVRQPGTSPEAASQRPPEEESREETDEDSAPEQGSESPPLL